jgi:hypothetical protein
VGNRGFDRAVVDHWARVIERGGAFTGFRGSPKGTARQRAVVLLLTSSWLIGEATRQGAPIGQAEVEQALSEHEEAGGEFQKRLRATGQTIAGVRLELQAELAAEAVREALASRADDVTQQQTLAFYRQNPRMFEEPEVRVTDLLENQPSPSVAKTLVGRVGTGARFTKLAFHEHVTKTPGFMGTAEKVQLVAAIFSARRGVVSDPLPLNGRWCVFIVRKVVPARPETFAQAHDLAATLLRVRRQHELIAKFDHEYTSLWRSRTTCKSGYVVAGCPQSTALLGAYEDPFSSRAHPLLSEEGVAG